MRLLPEWGPASEQYSHPPTPLMSLPDVLMRLRAEWGPTSEKYSHPPTNEPSYRPEYQTIHDRSGLA